MRLDPLFSPDLVINSGRFKSSVYLSDCGLEPPVLIDDLTGQSAAKKGHVGGASGGGHRVGSAELVRTSTDPQISGLWRFLCPTFNNGHEEPHQAGASEPEPGGGESQVNTGFVTWVGLRGEAAARAHHHTRSALGFDEVPVQFCAAAASSSSRSFHTAELLQFLLSDWL